MWFVKSKLILDGHVTLQAHQELANVRQKSDKMTHDETNRDKQNATAKVKELQLQLRVSRSEIRKTFKIFIFSET